MYSIYMNRHVKEAASNLQEAILNARKYRNRDQVQSAINKGNNTKICNIDERNNDSDTETNSIVTCPELDSYHEETYSNSSTCYGKSVTKHSEINGDVLYASSCSSIDDSNQHAEENNPLECPNQSECENSSASLILEYQDESNKNKFLNSNSEVMYKNLMNDEINGNIRDKSLNLHIDSMKSWENIFYEKQLMMHEDFLMRTNNQAIRDIEWKKRIRDTQNELYERVTALDSIEKELEKQSNRLLHQKESLQQASDVLYKREKVITEKEYSLERKAGNMLMLIQKKCEREQSFLTKYHEDLLTKYALPYLRRIQISYMKKYHSIVSYSVMQKTKDVLLLQDSKYYNSATMIQTLLATMNNSFFMNNWYIQQKHACITETALICCKTSMIKKEIDLENLIFQDSCTMLKHQREIDFWKNKTETLELSIAQQENKIDILLRQHQTEIQKCYTELNKHQTSVKNTCSSIFRRHISIDKQKKEMASEIKLARKTIRDLTTILIQRDLQSNPTIPLEEPSEGKKNDKKIFESSSLKSKKPKKVKRLKKIIKNKKSIDSRNRQSVRAEEEIDLDKRPPDIFYEEFHSLFKESKSLNELKCQLEIFQMSTEEQANTTTT